MDGLSPSGEGPPKKGRRDSRTAAVTITVFPQPGEAGEEIPKPSLAENLKKAITKINIGELSIEYLWPRKAKTRGLILEVSGEESTPKANLLSARLREVLSNNEGVRIARPVTMAELRITGLDDASTVEGVAAAVAETGGCSMGEVGIGDLKATPSGLMAVWARCPKSAADKVAKAGKIKVGWTMAKVETLKARPLQCHKCLCFGHVMAHCPAEEDRSNNCYRCGHPGHRATDYIAPPKGQLCVSKGRDASHRLDGPACPLSPNFKGRSGKRRRQKVPRS